MNEKIISSLYEIEEKAELVVMDYKEQEVQIKKEYETKKNELVNNIEIQTQNEIDKRKEQIDKKNLLEIKKIENEYKNYLNEILDKYQNKKDEMIQIVFERIINYD